MRFTKTWTLGIAAEVGAGCSLNWMTGQPPCTATTKHWWPYLGRPN